MSISAKEALVFAFSAIFVPDAPAIEIVNDGKVLDVIDGVGGPLIGRASPVRSWHKPMKVVMRFIVSSRSNTEPVV
jgi:hypothetical protein